MTVSPTDPRLLVHAYVDALSRIGVHRDLEEVSDVDLDRADRELLLF